MLKGKRRLNRKSKKAGKRKAGGKKRSRKANRFSLKQKRAAKARAEKHETDKKIFKSREARKAHSQPPRRLETATDSTTDEGSFADFCFDDDFNACTFNEIVDVFVCTDSENTVASQMCDSDGYPY